MSDEMYTVELASGGVQVVPYRRAVSLVSRGLAVWAAQSTAEEPEAPVEEEATDEPQASKQESELPDPVEQPTVKDRPRLKKTTKVSAPARKGQEGVSAENKPPKTE